MLNRVTIMGRLTADPELRTTEGGVPMCRISIACEEDRAPKDGQRETKFFDVQMWRGCAEFVSKYFTKGRMIVVDGRLDSYTYTDQSGAKRYRTEIVAENAYFGDSKSKDGAQPKAQADFSAAPAPAASAAPAPVNDDRYPF